MKNSVIRFLSVALLTLVSQGAFASDSYVLVYTCHPKAASETLKAVSAYFPANQAQKTALLLMDNVAFTGSFGSSSGKYSIHVDLNGLTFQLKIDQADSTEMNGVLEMRGLENKDFQLSCKSPN